MQKNNITEDFDLFIKGSLQDAEEKPSPRVWQGIVAKLDAAAAPAAGAFRWGWAVLAVAAAVAAVLIIPNNSNLSNKSSDRQVLAQAAVVEVADIPSPKAIAALPARQSRLAETAAEPVPAATDASATASESAASESAANAAFALLFFLAYCLLIDSDSGRKILPALSKTYDAKGQQVKGILPVGVHIIREEMCCVCK